MCHGSFGAGNYGMSGRAFDSRFLFAWPQSQISVMGAEQAANTLADVKVRQLAKQGKKLSQADIDAIRDPVLGEFTRTQSAYWSTSVIWDDGIIDPVDPRHALGMTFSGPPNTPTEEPSAGPSRPSFVVRFAVTPTRADAGLAV